MPHDYSMGYPGEPATLERILECMHMYHSEHEKYLSDISEGVKELNDSGGYEMGLGAQIAPTGNIGGSGFGGLGFGDGGMSGILLAILLGKRGFDGGCDGDDRDGRLLILKAMENRIDSVKEVADRLGCTLENAKDAICDVKAKVEAFGVKVDCVGERVGDVLCRLDNLKGDFCNFKSDVAKAFGDVQYRDLENKQETKDFVRIMHAEERLHLDRRLDNIDDKIEKFHHHVDKEFCAIAQREDRREIDFWKNKAQDSDNCRNYERSQRDNERNIQIIGSEIETKIVNLLSNNTAGSKND